MEDVVVRRRFGRRRCVDPQELVVRTAAEHAEALLRTARRHTACAADAEDAYQRALEIFVRRRTGSIRRRCTSGCTWWSSARRGRWPRRARGSSASTTATLDALDDGRHVASVEERSERFDDLARAAEALRRLKPQEVTALVLEAQGLSYQEIAERQDWTYTKVSCHVGLRSPALDAECDLDRSTPRAKRAACRRVEGFDASERASSDRRRRAARSVTTGRGGCWYPGRCCRSGRGPGRRTHHRRSSGPRRGCRR